ncbi:hypothetical protein FQN57_000771 [Myotisia sp. PD_48]|nr:hypothetical protein FQN57_000771 [Myotisia sp. PD_48]
MSLSPPAMEDNIIRSRSQERQIQRPERVRINARRRNPRLGRPLAPIHGRQRDLSPDTDDYDDDQGGIITSHKDLIPVIPTTGPPTDLDGHPFKDRLVQVLFRRPQIYVTTHPATPVNFRHWLTLLEHSVPNRWHSLIVLEDEYQYKRGVLSISYDPRPEQLDVPWLLNKNNAHKLVYLSVQQTLGGQRDGADIRTEIYRIVKSGSRDEAAAQAFYAAGALNWSTLFTCVMRDGRQNETEFRAAFDMYERVERLDDLIPDDEEYYKDKSISEDERKIRVFY